MDLNLSGLIHDAWQLILKLRVAQRNHFYILCHRHPLDLLLRLPEQSPDDRGVKFRFLRLSLKLQKILILERADLLHPRNGVGLKICPLHAFEDGKRRRGQSRLIFPIFMWSSERNVFVFGRNLSINGLLDRVIPDVF